MPVKPDRLFRLTIALILVALSVSLLLNVILFNRGQQYYLALNEARLDPLGLEYFTSDISQQGIDPDKITVVFFGDSRAARWPPPSSLECFEFINRGIGAQTSAQTLLRFDDHVKPLHPQVVIVQVGINDLKTIPLFPEQRATIIANTLENIQQIVTRSLDIGATVILTTIFPIGEVPIERRLFWSPDVALAVNEVNTYIGSFETFNLVIFDAYSILASPDEGSIQAAYAQDELHLNATGYEVLNNELVFFLTDLGRSGNDACNQR